MGTQRIQPAMFRSNLRDSHFQTGGIATDYMPQIYKFFRFCNNFFTFFRQNHQHCYPRAKVEVLIKLGVVLFGTYYREGTDRKAHLSTAITTKWKDSETVVRLRF